MTNETLEKAQYLRGQMHSVSRIITQIKSGNQLLINNDGNTDHIEDKSIRDAIVVGLDQYHYELKETFENL